MKCAACARAVSKQGIDGTRVMADETLIEEFLLCNHVMNLLNFPNKLFRVIFGLFEAI